MYLYKITYLAGDWVLVPNDVEDEEGEHVAGVREGRVEVDALLQFVLLLVGLRVALGGRARLAAGGPAPARPLLRRGGRLVVCAAGVGGLLLPSLGIYWGASLELRDCPALQKGGANTAHAPWSARS